MAATPQASIMVGGRQSQGGHVVALECDVPWNEAMTYRCWWLRRLSFHSAHLYIFFLLFFILNVFIWMMLE